MPAGVVNDVAGAFELAERLGLDPIVAVPVKDGNGDVVNDCNGDAVALTRNPIALSRTPPSYRSAPPSLPETG